MYTYHFRPVEACNMCGASDARIWGRRLNQPQGLRPKTRTGISVSVMKCNECGLLYANPQPIPKDISDHYGLVPEDYWSEETYFEPEEDFFRFVLDNSQRLAPHARTFLDIGAGLGHHMRSAAARGLEAYGVEPGSQFRDRAIEKMGIKSDRIVNASIEDADFPRMFDVISFSAVLEHLYDPSACLAKAFSWLNPGGIIHLEVPSSDFLMSKLFNLYFWLRGTDFVVNISPMHKPFHLYEFTRRSFEKNGARLGYKIAYFQTYATSTVITPRLSNVMRPVMNRTRTGDSLVFYLTPNV